jgi:hypothetical protein
MTSSSSNVDNGMINTGVDDDSSFDKIRQESWDQVIENRPANTTKSYAKDRKLFKVCHCQREKKKND